MTPKQAQRLQAQITQIKRTLAAEKRKFGGYDDSRGLRYRPLGLYLKLQDYKGGLSYTRWFAKAFPDDIGFPDFLFEWTVILFKTGHLPQAQVKAWQTFCSNTYVLEKYLGRAIEPVDKYEWSNLASVAFTDHFTYSDQQPELADFSEWLKQLMASERFAHSSQRYVEIHQQLQHEQDRKRREQLLKEADQLETSFNG
ncbi:hypothetical protein ACFQ4C_07165 [Larkinella insperata]|uniref:Uncharacterized protein n=1 Tax=Larkinella insperata TaxID=332158 RepID=A0ABW3Q848_9BACT